MTVTAEPFAHPAFLYRGAKEYLVGTLPFIIDGLDAGEPVLGVVYDVTRELMYAAARGQGAWIGTRRLMAQTGKMSDSSLLMLTSNLLDRSGKLPAWVGRWLSQTAGSMW